jgi:hypothetical protein
MQAAQLFEQGQPQAEIVRPFGVSRAQEISPARRLPRLAAGARENKGR